MPIGTSDGDTYDNAFEFARAQVPLPKADPRTTPLQGLFDTPLNPGEEKEFQIWKQQNAPNDSGEDYDLRGAFKEGITADPNTGHWPDTWKKPNHPTFSDQSVYAPYGDPGTWNGDQYIANPRKFLKPYTGPYDDSPVDSQKGKMLDRFKDQEKNMEDNLNYNLFNEDDTIKNMTPRTQKVSDTGDGPLKLKPEYKPNYDDPTYMSARQAYSERFNAWNAEGRPGGYRTQNMIDRNLIPPTPPNIPIKEGESGRYSLVNADGKPVGHVNVTIQKGQPASTDWRGNPTEAKAPRIHIDMIRSEVDPKVMDERQANLSEYAKRSNWNNQTLGFKAVRSLVREADRIWPGHEIEGYRVSGAKAQSARTSEGFGSRIQDTVVRPSAGPRGGSAGGTSIQQLEQVPGLRGNLNPLN